MIYDEYFSREWDSLDRDEAMVRAFVLGVDAVREEEVDDEELDRLRRAENRTYVEMAYKEGKRKFLDLKAEKDLDDEEVQPSGRTYEQDAMTSSVQASEILSEIIVTRRAGNDEEDLPDGPSRIDVPGMLQQFGFLDTTVNEQDRLRLPDFLRE